LADISDDDRVRQGVGAASRLDADRLIVTRVNLPRHEAAPQSIRRPWQRCLEGVQRNPTKDKPKKTNGYAGFSHSLSSGEHSGTRGR